MKQKYTNPPTIKLKHYLLCSLIFFIQHSNLWDGHSNICFHHSISDSVKGTFITWFVLTKRRFLPRASKSRRGGWGRAPLADLSLVKLVSSVRSHWSHYSDLIRLISLVNLVSSSLITLVFDDVWCEHPQCNDRRWWHVKCKFRWSARTTILCKVCKHCSSMIISRSQECE